MSGIKRDVVGFTRVFKEGNINWGRHIESNLFFIKAVEAMLNEKLNIKGWLLLNDVFQSLGFHQTSQGSIVGWCKFAERGKNHISFDLEYNDECPDLGITINIQTQGSVFQYIDQCERGEKK